MIGVDWGKEDSKSVGTISEYWLNGTAKNFSTVNWTMHPIYLELKSNIDVKCEVDNNGKITGTVLSNLYLSKQWFLDFEKRCCLNKGILSMSSWQNPNFQGLLNFQIYLDCAVCNQCDQPDESRPKIENYTCQKCWSR